MRPLRLLFVTTIVDTSDSFLEESASEAAQRGWHVELATNLSGAAVRDRPYAKLHHVSWGRGFASPSGTVRAISPLRNLMRTGGFDIVHTHTPTASSITRLVARSLPAQVRPKLIYTAHGFHFGEDLQGLTAGVARATESALLPLTDLLITINDEDEAWARRRAAGRSTSVKRTKGVGLRDSFYGNTPTGTVVRDELGIGADAFVASVIGELMPRKRVELALQAVAEMGGGDRHLLVIGDGPLAETLRQNAQSLAERNPGFHPHFLGLRNDIPECLAACDVMVHTAAQEGLPTVVLESMALGVPVTSFDLRGNRDLLRSGAGVLVPNGDVASMTSALRDIRSNPDQARAMGAEGARDAGGYARGVLAAQMCDIYASVAEPASAADGRGRAA